MVRKEEFESPCDVPFDLDDIIDISWEFNPPTPNEEALFLSSNPISSILLIDAGANSTRLLILMQTWVLLWFQILHLITGRFQQFKHQTQKHNLFQEIDSGVG